MIDLLEPAAIDEHGKKDPEAGYQFKGTESSRLSADVSASGANGSQPSGAVDTHDASAAQQQDQKEGNSASSSWTFEATQLSPGQGPTGQTRDPPPGLASPDSMQSQMERANNIAQNSGGLVDAIDAANVVQGGISACPVHPIRQTTPASPQPIAKAPPPALHSAPIAKAPPPALDSGFNAESVKHLMAQAEQEGVSSEFMALLRGYGGVAQPKAPPTSSNPDGLQPSEVVWETSWTPSRLVDGSPLHGSEQGVPDRAGSASSRAPDTEA